MATNQKYYYMRLRADFFSRKDIILLESMPNGAVYCLILQSVCGNTFLKASVILRLKMQL